MLQKLAMSDNNAEWELRVGNGSSEIITLEIIYREPGPAEPQIQNQIAFPS